MTRKEWAAMKAKFAEQDRRARNRTLMLIAAALAGLICAAAFLGCARPTTREPQAERGLRRMLNGNDE